MPRLYFCYSESMLRDFQYNPNAQLLFDVLKRFDLDSQAHVSMLSILRFELLSPDSFAWKLLLGNTIYYLYAEDFIPDLSYVKDTLTEYIGTEKWIFIPVQKPVAFESAAPVKGAEIYQKPSDADELMRYAVDSGHDFVFLAKTLENSDDAHFSKK